MIQNHARFVLILIVTCMVSIGFAQGRPDPAKLIAEQLQAMKKLSFMDGVWRGYAADGKLIFNAFASLTFDVSTKTYQMNSHAQGNVGNFVLTPTANGFIWEIPAGPMVIRYTAEIKDGNWRQIGERIMTGKETVRFFEMNLKRIAESDWPAAGAIAHK